MNILQEQAYSELEIKKSRFIAELFPVDTQELCRVQLKAQKTLYSSASHVIHAFVLGTNENSLILGCSDDGEPSGTAGRPALSVLKGSQIGNALLTVTRYFGGTLLGTGGLVRAYTDSAKAVISIAKTVVFVHKTHISFTIPYFIYDRILQIIEKYAADILESGFTDVVFMRLSITMTETDSFIKDFQHTSNGLSVKIEEN